MNTDTHRFKHKEPTGKQFVRWTRLTRPSCSTICARLILNWDCCWTSVSNQSLRGWSLIIAVSCSANYRSRC